MEDVLRKLQLTQLGILEIIDKICVDNKIQYSLYAGSLIGAVRHQGFIPWDDDLDICMSRSNYEKFISIWEDCKPEGYILQNKENTPKFTQSFTKIRKEHTTFLQYDFERDAYHTGIFVDIFPLDRIPNGRLQRLYFKWNCMRYQLLTREFIPQQSNKIVKLVSKVILNLYIGEKRIQKRKELLKKIVVNNEDKERNVVAIETMHSLDKIYPTNITDDYIYLNFENKQYMCFKQYKKFLEIQYGDYMKLPPENERGWKHHPIILDFEHEYGEI